MKKFTVLLFFFLAILFSCDKIDDANTVDFDTSMSVNIPVLVTQPAGIATKSTEESYPFSASGTYSLSSNADISTYLEKIETISITSLRIMFSGISNDEVIERIDVEVEGVGILFTLNDVSASSLNQSPDVDNVKLTEAAHKLRSSKAITIKVSGSTNTAPMDFSVKVDFDLYVEAKVI